MSELRIAMRLKPVNYMRLWVLVKDNLFYQELSPGIVEEQGTPTISKRTVMN